LETLEKKLVKKPEVEVKLTVLTIGVYSSSVSLQYASFVLLTVCNMLLEPVLIFSYLLK